MTTQATIQYMLPLEMRARCQFWAPLQCVYVATEWEDYCDCHGDGAYWPHFTLKDYERQERF